MAKKKAGRTAPAANESKWQRAFAGANAAGTKQPMFPEVGTFACTFLDLEVPDPVPGRKEWLIAKFDHDGTEYAQLFCMDNTSLASSLPRLKSLCMAILGATDEDEYNEWDPRGAFLSALQGFDNDYSEFAEGAKGSAKLNVIIARGNETNDGDWYRNPSFSVIAEDEEEEAPPAKKAKRK